MIKLKNKYPRVRLTHETERLETGGGFKKAYNFFHTDNILLINGDSLLVNNFKECPIQKLSKNFCPKKMDILLLLSSINNSVGYKGNGDFIKENNSVPSRIKRKTFTTNNRSAFIFTGWQIINKNILRFIDEKKFSLNVLYDLVEKNKRLYGVTYNGTFLHLSTPKSYIQVKKYLKDNRVKLL